eukprot:637769-Pelagomonas_calceolata.AAC.4
MFVQIAGLGYRFLAQALQSSCECKEKKRKCECTHDWVTSSCHSRIGKASKQDKYRSPVLFRRIGTWTWECVFRNLDRLTDRQTA